jgi:hypothetical protein
LVCNPIEKEGDQMANWWHEKPMRLVQTNLRQIDIKRDPREIVREVKNFHANAILFSVGGIVSFYPSELEFQTPIPELKGDFVGEAVNEARSQGLKFIARLDLSKCHKHVYEKHPEWFYRKADGNPVIYNGLYSTCINGGYYRQYSFKIMEEIFSRYEIDGFFFNMFGYQTHDYSGNYHGLCQCESCQKRFRAMFGRAVPQREDRSDTAYLDFLQFRRITVDEVAEAVRDFIHYSRPNVAFLTGAVRQVDILRSESNSAVDRPLPMWQYSGSDNVKRVRGTYPSKPVSNSAVYFLDIPYRFVSVSPHLTTLRLAQDLANGGGLDLYVLGTLDQEDKIALEPARDIFRFFAENEDVYHNLSSIADVCLIKGDDREYRGILRMLTENHILFDCAYSFALEEDNPKQFLEKYKVLILPAVASLSDKQIQVIDNFVRNGGRLLATGETALLDGKGGVRDGYGLKCLGTESVKTRRDRMRSAYFSVGGEITEASQLSSPIFLDGIYLYTSVKENAESLWNLIPPSVYGPPEKCFIDKLETDIPGVIKYPYGDGSTAYFPWNIGSLYYRHSSHGHEKAFLSILMDLCGGDRQIITNAHPSVEINLSAQKDRIFVLNLVNSSGHQSTAFFEPITMYDIDIEMKLPKKAKTAFSLKLDKEVHLSEEDEYTCITLEKLKLFDTVVITPR